MGAARQELRETNWVRRQQVISGFIVDYYCHKADLIIEVNGDVHDLQKEEVLNNLFSVVERIKKHTSADPQ